MAADSSSVSFPWFSMDCFTSSRRACKLRRKGVETVQEALQGASDIIAEWISDDADVRKLLRDAGRGGPAPGREVR